MTAVTTRAVATSVFRSVDGDVELAGTLMRPEGRGPFPAAVLVAGSGALDRDSSAFGHRPFARLAQQLAAGGIATLRYDKRGSGLSGGDYSSAGINDHVADVCGAAAQLRSTPSLVAAVGLIGHSEGAANATYAAASGIRADFLVLLAGSGVSGMELLMRQHQRLSQHAGLSEKDVEQTGALQQRVLRAICDVEDMSHLEGVLRRLFALMGEGPALEAEIERLTRPWLRDFLVRDPTKALARVPCPILSILGELDVQVAPEQSLPSLRNAISQGPPGSTLEVWPGVNHLFQEARTGLPNEYAQLPEGMANVAPRILSWLDEIGLRGGSSR